MTLEELMARSNARQPKPKRRQDDEEHRIQVSCVQWFRLTHPKLYYRLFAIPNGGGRSKREGGRLKAEGVLAGVADLILLKPSGAYGALLIEMKTGKGGSRQSGTQKEWQKDLCSSGEYRYVVCRSLDDFIREVDGYLKGAGVDDGFLN